MVDSSACSLSGGTSGFDEADDDEEAAAEAGAGGGIAGDEAAGPAPPPLIVVTRTTGAAQTAEQISGLRDARVSGRLRWCWSWLLRVLCLTGYGVHRAVCDEAEECGAMQQADERLQPTHATRVGAASSSRPPDVRSPVLPVRQVVRRRGSRPVRLRVTAQWGTAEAEGTSAAESDTEPSARHAGSLPVSLVFLQSPPQVSCWSPRCAGTGRSPCCRAAAVQGGRAQVHWSRRRSSSKIVRQSNCSDAGVSSTVEAGASKTKRRIASRSLTDRSSRAASHSIRRRILSIIDRTNSFEASCHSVFSPSTTGVKANCRSHSVLSRDRLLRLLQCRWLQQRQVRRQ